MWNTIMYVHIAITIMLLRMKSNHWDLLAWIPTFCFSYFNPLIDIGLTETRLQEHRSGFIPSERSKTI